MINKYDQLTQVLLNWRRRTILERTICDIIFIVSREWSFRDYKMTNYYVRHIIGYIYEVLNSFI